MQVGPPPRSQTHSDAHDTRPVLCEPWLASGAVAVYDMLRQHLRSAATGGGIGAVGDVLMQYREFRQRESAQQLDSARTARVMGYRLMHAPIVESAWRLLDASLAARGGMLASGLTGAVSRALCDQCLLAPPSIAAFFMTQSLLEGCTASESVERVRTSFVPAFMVAFPCWMCAHTITFGLIRPEWRMAWASTVAVFWNAFLSGRNQQAKATT